MTVLDGTLVSTPATVSEPARVTTPDPVFSDPRDIARCATESRLVRELLDGTIDRGRYHAEMAALAAGDVSPPVRMPGDPI